MSNFSFSAPFVRKTLYDHLQLQSKSPFFKRKVLEGLSRSVAEEEMAKQKAFQHRTFPFPKNNRKLRDDLFPSLYGLRCLFWNPNPLLSSSHPLPPPTILTEKLKEISYLISAGSEPGEDETAMDKLCASPLYVEELKNDHLNKPVLPRVQLAAEIVWLWLLYIHKRDDTTPWNTLRGDKSISKHSQSTPKTNGVGNGDFDTYVDAMNTIASEIMGNDASSSSYHSLLESEWNGMNSSITSILPVVSCEEVAPISARQIIELMRWCVESLIRYFDKSIFEFKVEIRGDRYTDSDYVTGGHEGDTNKGNKPHTHKSILDHTKCRTSAIQPPLEMCQLLPHRRGNSLDHGFLMPISDALPYMERWGILFSSLELLCECLLAFDMKWSSSIFFFDAAVQHGGAGVRGDRTEKALWPNQPIADGTSEKEEEKEKEKEEEGEEVMWSMTLKRLNFLLSSMLMEMKHSELFNQYRILTKEGSSSRGTAKRRADIENMGSSLGGNQVTDEGVVGLANSTSDDEDDLFPLWLESDDQAFLGMMKELQFSNRLMHRLLCLQRETWESAFSTLYGCLRWNIYMSSSREVVKIPFDLLDGDVIAKQGERNILMMAELLQNALAASLISHEIFLTYMFILAQHGRTEEVLVSFHKIAFVEDGAGTADHRSESIAETLLHWHYKKRDVCIDDLRQTISQRDILHIIVALALVDPDTHRRANSTGNPSTSFANQEGEDSTKELLPLLITLGVSPRRSLSVSEFAFLQRSLLGSRPSNHSEVEEGIKQVKGTHDFLLGDTILSPALVWHQSKSLASHVRETLVLQCFSIVAKCGFASSLTLEDIFVTIRVLQNRLKKRSNLVTALLFSYSSCLDSTEVGAKRNLTTPREFSSSVLVDFLTPATRRNTFQYSQLAHTYMNKSTDYLVSTKGYVRNSTLEAKKSRNKDDSSLACVKVSPILLALVSREMAKLLLQCGNSGRVWDVALRALELWTQYDTAASADATRFADHIAASLVDTFLAVKTDISRRACRTGDSHLISGKVEPILAFLPYLSPFSVGKIAMGSLGHHLTWEQSLKCATLTPSGSLAQIYLFRRVAQSSRTNCAPLIPFMKGFLTLPHALILREGSTSISADQRLVSILVEQKWLNALKMYINSPSRIQNATAFHVVRLVIEAGAWRGEDYLRPLLREAVQGRNGYSLSEEIMHTTLHLGHWHSGLQFFDFLQKERVEWCQASSLIRTHVTILCETLLKKVELTRLIATVTQCIRRSGNWQGACTAFTSLSGSHKYIFPSLTPSTCQLAGTSSATISRLSESTGSVDSKLALAAVREEVEIVTSSSQEAATTTDSPQLLLPFLYKCSPMTFPKELLHLVHTLRYSFLHTKDLWRDALRLFPPSSVPLPESHVKAMYSSFSQETVSNLLGASSFVQTELLDLGGSLPENYTVSSSRTLASHSNDHLADPLPLLFSTAERAAASLSLTEAAKLGKRRRLITPDVSATQENVQLAIDTLEKLGHWEQATLIYERALAANCFPYSAAASVLSSCCRAGSWAMAILIFHHMASRMRPDLPMLSHVLEACAASGRWDVALGALRYSFLTRARLPPKLIHFTLSSALRGGQWCTALDLTRRFLDNSSNPTLLNTMLKVFVLTQRWNEAVEYFYRSVVLRGMIPLDESLQFAVVASREASEEYRETARMVTVMTSILEDLCKLTDELFDHVSGVYAEFIRNEMGEKTNFLEVMGQTNYIILQGNSSNVDITLPENRILVFSSGLF